MMKPFFKLNWVIPLLFLMACGGSGKLDIKGSPEAVQMAESMLKALGGKKAWTRLKSVYIRTIARVASEGEPYVYEEWTNLTEPKFMNRKTVNGSSVIEIVDGNDGWTLRDSRMEMISPQRITNYRQWHDQYFLRMVKQIAMENENLEVRKKNDRTLEVLMNGALVSGFELNNQNLPEKYYVARGGGKSTTIYFKEFSEYKGYKFPLEIASESMLATYRTDYFDPSHLDAEKAFNLTFNPNELIKQMN
jgi:hypothetical protein